MISGGTQHVAIKGKRSFCDQIALIRIVNTKRKKMFSSAKRQIARSTLEQSFYGVDGVIRNPETINLDVLAEGMKVEDLSHYFLNRERAKVAIQAAQFFQGGDYMEFGSIGANTMRNFLSAAKFTNIDTKYPETLFWAFDFFGDFDGISDESKKVFSSSQEKYFNNWSSTKEAPKPHHQADEFMKIIHQHGVLAGRVRTVAGYFEDTLNTELREKFKAEDRKIGFAFLDCNLVASYRTVFSFITDFIFPGSFIYLDENYVRVGEDGYDIKPAVEEFKKDLAEKNMVIDFICSAGAFGALYLVRR